MFKYYVDEHLASKNSMKCNERNRLSQYAVKYFYRRLIVNDLLSSDAASTSSSSSVTLSQIFILRLTELFHPCLSWSKPCLRVGL